MSLGAMKKKTAPMGASKVAIAYLRVSTEEQKLGPEAQRANIEAWAAREGVTVIAWHLDQGVSGGKDIDERPGLVAALAALRAEAAGVLVVSTRDRLARDSFVALAIERAAKACGAVIVSADGNGNGTSATDAFLRDILNAVAAFERSLIGTRTKAALARKSAKRERVGSVPLGFRVGDDGKTLERDDGEQRALERMRALREEGLSMVRIAAALTTEGFPSRSGNAWNPAQVHRVLRRAA